jgi:hypothetical protein
MIAHYVAVHHYLPPKEFRDAVMRVEVPGCGAYERAVAPFRVAKLV